MSDPSTALAGPDQGPPAADPVEPATVATDTAPEVQPGTPPDGAQSTPPEGGGQDFIAPYLEGVDESIRDTVAERLEQFRKDQDANVNKRFEQTTSRLKAYEDLATDPAHLETPVALYENLMQDPKGTLQWVVEQFKTEMGVDLRAELLKEWGQAPTGEQPAGEQAQDPNDPDAPLTRKQFEAMQAEQRQQAQQAEQQAQARAQADGWLTEAAQKHGLEIGEGDIVLKEAILRQAATLMPSVRDGQKAIQMATEAFTNRFAPKTKTPSNAPKVAEGGSPAAPPKVDWSDQRQRQDAMLSMLKAAQNPEG